MQPASVNTRVSGLIPARAGIGLRAQHYREILDSLPAVGWMEAHSENYFGAGGQPLYFLEKIRGHYPLSLHGVGLSLGSVDPLSLDHLGRLKRLINRIEPGLVSEHLCWCSFDGRFANDLLPLPYTQESFKHICRRVMTVQDFLGRQILVENVSSYLQFKDSTIAEWQFLGDVASETGCGILLDVNNIFVNAMNHGFDSKTYMEAIPAAAVKEIHLAGFDSDGQCLIDTHGKPVAEEVWALYRDALRRLGDTPTLVEWDRDIPALHVLVAEARKADAILREKYDAIAV